MGIRLNQAKAFTLIELLIVVAIMGTAMTLVGPNLFKALNTAQFRSDVGQLKNTFNRIAYKAFATDRVVVVTLRDNSIRYSFADDNARAGERVFEYIQFEPQQVTFSSYGFPDKSSIFVTFNDQRSDISLDGMNIL